MHICVKRYDVSSIPPGTELGVSREQAKVNQTDLDCVVGRGPDGYVVPVCRNCVVVPPHWAA